MIGVPRPPDSGSRARRWSYPLAVVVPLAVTVLGARIALPAFIFEHLMIVLVVVLAIAGGPGPAVLTAIVGGIGDNLLLREPIGRPAITGVRDAVDLGLFLVVAMIVGWLVDGLREARARAVRAAEGERLAREEIDRLVTTVTHDLATPLNAIQGTIQFAHRHAALSADELARLLTRVETAAARATSLLRTLADSKSIEGATLSIDRRPIDLRAVIEPVARMLDRTSDRHPIVVAMDPTPLLVDGDAERLGRVVENLVTNAIKYSPGGGVIELRASQDRDWVALTVRDHGIGFPPDSRLRLFELGYRTPQAASMAPGLGLGLYIASEVIRRHGGTIDAAPAESGGAIFTVRLPRAPHLEPVIGEPRLASPDTVH